MQDDDDDDDDDADDDDKEEKDKPMTPAEISAMEAESSRKVSGRLELPGRIGEAVSAAAYLFVACGLLLNFFGYAYVLQDNHTIRIDTLENRQFQVELIKSMKESANERRHR
jgi:hypothetical protein